MAPVPNPRVLFKEIPEDYPVPGKSTVYDESQTIDPDTVPLNGGFLLKILQLSLDPYMRSRMRDPSIESYVPAFVVDQPLENWGIAVVVRSEHPEVKAGEHLLGFYPYQHYVVMQEPKTIMDLPLEKVDKRVMPPEAYLGPCGLPGQTAYYGWKEYAKPKKGDVAFVTTAGGPVGSVVVQLAKADGLKVIASAGSDEKVAWVKEIGADVAFNYKTTDVRKVLEKEGPINIYWDHVGGEQLEAAIDHAARDASFIECGMASDYNTTNPYHVKNLVKIVTQSLQLHGFVYFYLAHKHIADFRSQYVPSVASGDIKYRTWAVRGLENAQQALVDVLSGRNFGKAILVVADE